MGVAKRCFTDCEIQEQQEEAFVLAIGLCFVCGKAFQFNPVHVPSYKGNPLCLECVTHGNSARKLKGLDLWPILPDAYEPCAESLLLTLKSRNDEN